MRNVRKEKELYAPMRNWLEQYLKDNYPNYNVIAVDTSEVTLDTILEKYGIIDQYPQAVGLNIQIDVLGIAINETESKLVFIEAKKEALNLHHLGQLLVYCKMIDPAEAFLMSSLGMGSLNKILVNLHREDLLEYGRYMMKKLHVSAWDILSNCPDMKTMVPRI